MATLQSTSQYGTTSTRALECVVSLAQRMSIPFQKAREMQRIMVVAVLFIKLMRMPFILQKYCRRLDRASKYYLDHMSCLPKNAASSLLKQEEYIRSHAQTLDEAREIFAPYLAPYQRKALKKTSKDLHHLLSCIQELRGEITPLPIADEREEEITVERAGSTMEVFLSFPLYVKAHIILISAWSLFFVVAGIADLVGAAVFNIRFVPAMVAAVLIGPWVMVYFRNPRQWSLRRCTNE